MKNFYLTLAIAIAALFLRVNNRPIFHRSVYDSADAEYTRRSHLQEPIVNAGPDLSVSHTSRRGLGDAGEHFVDISYDGLLRGDVPIVKLDNILSLERVTCFENQEFLSIELDFSSSEELSLSRHLLARGNLLVAGHQWECAHSRGAIVMAKIESVNDDKTSSAKCLITAQHIEYNDIFTNLRLEFSTNAYADRNQGIIRREAESPSCPGFSKIDVDFKDNAILSTFFNILNQAEQVTAGLKAAVVGLAKLKDSLSAEWNDDGVSFSTTLGMNYNERTGNATCEIPLAELDGAPLLNCRNCYAYATATLSMSIDITGGQFNQVEVKLLGETGLKIELELDQTALLTRTMVEDIVSDYALSAPITFLVGPIPVFIIPTSSITVGAVSGS